MIFTRSELRYQQYVDFFLIPQKKNFKIVTTNSSKTAMWNKKKKYGYVYRNRLSDEQLKTLWVFPAVSKSVRNYIKENPSFEILPPCPSVKYNLPLCDKLKVGQVFKATDIQHCYWRVSHLMGIIKYKLYRRMLHKKYKLVRNKALACISSVDKIEEYKRGVLYRTSFEGDADMQNIYMNIRHKSYSYMEDIGKKIKGGFLKYKIDCIYYLPEYQEKVENLLKKHGLLYQTTDCTYIGKSNFIENDEVKKL